VAAHEAALLNRLRSGLAAVPGLAQLRLFDEDSDENGADPQAVGTVSFVVAGLDSGWLAAVLSAEYGIGVRDGAFCPHVATRRLIDRTGVDAVQALRVSIGLGATDEHVDRLLLALRQVIGRGARWDYARQDGRWTPSPDPRPLPDFLEGWGEDPA
jgi:selenocysteine lyase/cysteine desulfurase